MKDKNPTIDGNGAKLNLSQKSALEKLGHELYALTGKQVMITNFVFDGNVKESPLPEQPENN